MPIADGSTPSRTRLFVGKLRRDPGEAPLEIGQHELERLRPLLFRVELDSAQPQQTSPWASAHRDKWGQLTHLENGRKIIKRKHAKKEQFSEYFESNQGRQV